MYDASFEDVKVGDTVVYSNRGGSYFLRQVVRVTKTRFYINVTPNIESDFHKKGGRSVGTSTWYHTHCYRPTSEVMKMYQADALHRAKQTLIEKIKKCLTTDLELKVLDDCYKLLVPKTIENDGGEDGSNSGD